MTWWFLAVQRVCHSSVCISKPSQTYRWCPSFEHGPWILSEYANEHSSTVYAIVSNIRKKSLQGHSRDYIYNHSILRPISQLTQTVRKHTPSLSLFLFVSISIGCYANQCNHCQQQYCTTNTSGYQVPADRRVRGCVRSLSTCEGVRVCRGERRVR